MSQIAVNVDEELLEHFREVIYHKHGLKRGDLKRAIEEVMQDYIRKYRSDK